jgi:hypothetical protein
LNLPLESETATADLLSDLFRPTLRSDGPADGMRSAELWQMTGSEFGVLVRTMETGLLDVGRDGLALRPLAG